MSNEKKPRGSSRQRRSQIVDHLRASGDVVDAGGRASRELERAIGGQSSPASFAQLLTAMDRAGQIRREVRGKRTYRIALGPNADQLARHASAPAADADGGDEVAGALPVDGDGGGPVPMVRAGRDETDYDELALALLRKVARTLAPTSDTSYGHIGTARAERRIVNLERRLNEAERALARAGADNDELRRENVDLQARLHASSQTIDNLMGQLNQRRSATPASHRLDDDDKEVLNRLRQPSADRTEAERSQTG